MSLQLCGYSHLWRNPSLLLATTADIVSMSCWSLWNVILLTCFHTWCLVVLSTNEHVKKPWWHAQVDACMKCCAGLATCCNSRQTGQWVFSAGSAETWAWGGCQRHQCMYRNWLFAAVNVWLLIYCIIRCTWCAALSILLHWRLLHHQSM